MRHGRWWSDCALVAAVPVITAIAACDQPASAPLGPAPITDNQPPQITAHPVSPALGIDGVTTFSARVEVRDPDGEAVALRGSGCSLGDQTPVPITNGVAMIAFQSSRNCGSTITLVATDARGNSTAAALAFQHTRFERGYRLVIGEGFYDQPWFSVTLSQDGATITGTIRDSRSYAGAIDPEHPGAIDGEGRFRLRFKIQSEADFEIAGQVIAPGADNLFNDIVVATGRVTSSQFAGRAFKLWREAQY